MAFKARELSVLAYANGFTLWHYASADPLADVVVTPGYFDAASDMLRAGDLILAVVVRDSTAPEAGLLLVTLSDDGGVMVTGAPAPMARSGRHTTPQPEQPVQQV